MKTEKGNQREQDRTLNGLTVKTQWIKNQNSKDLKHQKEAGGGKKKKKVLGSACLLHLLFRAMKTSVRLLSACCV